MRQTERHRQRERQTERHRQTERQTDRRERHGEKVCIPKVLEDSYISVLPQQLEREIVRQGRKKKH